MITEGMVRAGLRRLSARKAEARKPDDAATPQEKLVRAAETGQFEAIVAKAQPAEPPKMVTPEEREAELRAKGEWPDAPQPQPEAGTAPPALEPESPAPEPGMPTEPTAGMKWAEEHLIRRPRGARDVRPRIPYGRCLTEYDVLTGEIIG